MAETFRKLLNLAPPADPRHLDTCSIPVTKCTLGVSNVSRQCFSLVLSHFISHVHNTYLLFYLTEKCNLHLQIRSKVSGKVDFFIYPTPLFVSLEVVSILKKERGGMFFLTIHWLIRDSCSFCLVSNKMLSILRKREREHFVREEKRVENTFQHSTTHFSIRFNKKKSWFDDLWVTLILTYPNWRASNWKVEMMDGRTSTFKNENIHLRHNETCRDKQSRLSKRFRSFPPICHFLTSFSLFSLSLTFSK